MYGRVDIARFGIRKTRPHNSSPKSTCPVIKDKPHLPRILSFPNSLTLGTKPSTTRDPREIHTQATAVLLKPLPGSALNSSSTLNHNVSLRHVAVF